MVGGPSETITLPSKPERPSGLRDERKNTAPITMRTADMPTFERPAPSATTSVPTVVAAITQPIPRPRKDRSANDKAKCYVCRKARADHPSGKWCEKTGKARDARQNQKTRRAEQKKAQQHAAVKALEGGTALEAMTKVAVVPLDDPIAKREDPKPDHVTVNIDGEEENSQEANVVENAPKPATKEEKAEVIVSGRDTEIKSKEFYWHVGDLFALPSVNAFQLCLFVILLIIVSSFSISKLSANPYLLLINLIYVSLGYLYYIAPRLFFPHWIGTRVPIYSVVSNTVHVDLQKLDLRADNSKMVPVKHQNDVWLCQRRFKAFVPKVKTFWWQRMFLRLPNHPHHIIGSAHWTPVDLSIDNKLIVSHAGWTIDISDTLYRPHSFYVSISQVAQHGQLHFVGGLSREEAVRKLNLLSRNASGVTYDRYSMFKETGDTLAHARDFTRHVLQDHLLRTNDLPEDFSSAPQH